MAETLHLAVTRNRSGDRAITPGIANPREGDYTVMWNSDLADVELRSGTL